MTQTPPLKEGETVLHNHVPSQRAFKRTALLMIGLTLPAVVVFLFVFPDTYWPAVPLFVTCLLLMQERVTLGRHRAWVTNQRILFQGARAVSLADITDAKMRGNGVRISVVDGAKPSKLVYPDDGTALAALINTARQEAA